MLGESVAAQHAHVVPLGQHSRHDWRTLSSANGAPHDVSEPAVLSIRTGEYAEVDIFLRDRLVPGHLCERSLPKQIAAAVPHLKEIAAGPQTEPQGERCGHAHAVWIPHGMAQ